MGARFTVGEMAKMSGISKQMLIFYDNEGVFSPSFVGENGYRYYTSDQLEVLDSVLILRELGVPLKEIKRHMEHLDFESSLHLLITQKEQAEEKMRRLSLLHDRLTEKITSLQRPMEPGCRLMEKDAEYLMVVPVDGDQSLVALDISLKTLLWRYSDLGCQHFYEIGSMGLVDNIKSGVYDRYEYGFLTLKKPGSAENAFTKPAGTYASALHKGTYQTTGVTYEAMLAAIGGAGFAPAGYTYEYSIWDSLTSRPDEYLTELQIRIEKK